MLDYGILTMNESLFPFPFFFPTYSTVHAGPWPPLGSISRRLYSYLHLSSVCNISFLQIIFGIVKPSLSWLSNGPFFFIPGHS